LVPHTGCAEIRVIRANLTRFTPHEPLWDAWCDSIRVLAWAQHSQDRRWHPGRVTRTVLRKEW